MLIQKGIKAKIHGLTKIKAKRISQEYQSPMLALALKTNLVISPQPDSRLK